MLIFPLNDAFQNSLYQQEDKFINLALNFIIEILSKNDNSAKFKVKMEEYINNGI